MSRIRVVDTHDTAAAMRKAFYAKNVSDEETMNFSWPTKFVEAGRVLSEKYTSDKWKAKADFEDYKHLTEGPQRLYVVPGFLLDGETSRAVSLPGQKLRPIEPMPQHFAKLAPLLGFHYELLEGYDTPRNRSERKRVEARAEDAVFELGDDVPVFPPSDSVFNCVTFEMWLAGAVHPETELPFLFLYHETEGIRAIITGDILAVEKDGIVG